jgi:hypothetical protein
LDRRGGGAMIAEDLLERGLAEAAREYDVPAGAVDRIRDQLAPLVEDDQPSWRHARLRRPSRNVLMSLGAASIVVLIAVAIAVGGGGSQGTGESAGSAASTGSMPASEISGAVAGGAQGSTAHRDAVRVPAAVPAPAAAGTAATTGSGAASGYGTSSGAGAVAGPVTPVPSVPDRIVKTGELDLQVPKGEVTSTLNRLTGLATLVSGYVADSRTSEGGIAPSGEITLRVPVNKFDNTISRARAITGVKVLALETSAKDVTSKYVDLQARLKALQQTRDTFLTLLSRARTIGETLAVQQHVTDVQTQIEQLQGQLKVLANQSALSTLTVTVDQKVTPVAAKPHHQKSGLHKAIDRSVSRFVHGIEAIIGVIGPLLLAALLIALFWFGGRFGYRVLRRRMV